MSITQAGPTSEDVGTMKRLLSISILRVRFELGIGSGIPIAGWTIAHTSLDRCGIAIQLLPPSSSWSGSSSYVISAFVRSTNILMRAGIGCSYPDHSK